MTLKIRELVIRAEISDALPEEETDRNGIRPLDREPPQGKDSISSRFLLEDRSKDNER